MSNYDDYEDDFGIRSWGIRLLSEVNEERRKIFEAAQTDLLKGLDDKLPEGSRAPENIYPLYNNQHLSDLTLKVGERHFHAHRLILSVWSDVFKMMLYDPNWQAKNTSSVTYQELKEEEHCEKVFDDFLKFLYTSGVNLSLDNVMPLIRLADKYLVLELGTLCKRFIAANSSNVNLTMSLVQSASELTMPEMAEQCFRNLLTNFNLMTDEMIAHLHVDTMMALLDSNQDLVVDDEYAVFKKIEPWLEKCQDNDIFTKVISLIRFPYMTASQLKKATDTKVFSRVDALLPDFCLTIWQLQSLYNERNLKELPEDFPPPRLYLNTGENKSFSIECSASEETYQWEVPSVSIVPMVAKRIDGMNGKRIFVQGSSWRLYFCIIPLYAKTMSISLAEEREKEEEEEEDVEDNNRYKVKLAVEARYTRGDTQYFVEADQNCPIFWSGPSFEFPINTNSCYEIQLRMSAIFEEESNATDK